MENGLHYSEIEIQDLIKKLGNTDCSRLLQNYNILGCSPRTGYSANDILQQAITQALANERPWPKNVNPVSYLTQSGRSIISNAAEKIEKHGIPVALDDVLTSDIENIGSTSSETSKLSHLSLQDDLEASQSKATIMG